MRAAQAFVQQLDDDKLLDDVWRLRIELFGSLALTGRGHGTDRAVQLGLAGLRPDDVQSDQIDPLLAEIARNQAIRLNARRLVGFDLRRDLLWHRGVTLAAHANAMRLVAFGIEGDILAADTYYSTGGGFIRREGEALANRGAPANCPYPYDSANGLLAHVRRTGLPLWQIVLANEAADSCVAQVRRELLDIWAAMRTCIDRGLASDGVLPGGLKVKRRAPRLFARMAAAPVSDPLTALDRVNVYAMAVSEENAAGGRVVTAPTNGAAGVIPAVLRYYEESYPDADEGGVIRFLLTAGAIGALYKDNASISGAEVGCQGEVGVACSMAAGGLVAALGGTEYQIEQAAEIGMEHHLGMTCDPIAGLVQIPCIERNAVGAAKAINACRLAMQGDGEARISLDQIIRTMFETGRDMQARYKETSLGGLAVLGLDVE